MESRIEIFTMASRIRPLRTWLGVAVAFVEIGCSQVSGVVAAAPPTVLLEGTGVFAVRVDTERVYAASWCDAEASCVKQVISCPLSHCDGPPEEVLAILPNGRTFEIDDAYVYVDQLEAGEYGYRDRKYVKLSGDTVSVVRVPKRGGEPQPLVAIDRDATGESIRDLAVDDRHVYFTVRRTNGRGGAVRRVSKSGGPVETLAELEPENAPLVIAVDDENVFWSATSGFSGAPAKLMRLAKAGGAVEVLAQTRLPAHGIALDAEHVYVSTKNHTAGDLRGDLLAVPKVGGAPRVLLRDERMRSDLAVHEGQLYCFILDAEALTARGEFIGDLTAIPVGGGPRRILATAQRGARALTAGPIAGIVWATEDSVANEPKSRVLTGSLHRIAPAALPRAASDAKASPSLDGVPRR